MSRTFESYALAHRAKVFRTAFNLTRDRAEAEDLTQDALVRAFQSFDRYSGDRPFENWVMRITTNLYRDRLRAARRRPRCESYDAAVTPDGCEDATFVEFPDPSPSALDAVIAAEREATVARAIKDVSVPYREAAVLVLLHGESYEGAAQSLALPVGTLRSRVHRARNELKELINGARRGLFGEGDAGQVPCPVPRGHDGAA